VIYFDPVAVSTDGEVSRQLLWVSYVLVWISQSFYE